MNRKNQSEINFPNMKHTEIIFLNKQNNNQLNINTLNQKLIKLLIRTSYCYLTTTLIHQLISFKSQFKKNVKN